MAKNPKKFHLRMKYDFSVDGGANGAANHIALATNATIPDNAIVTDLTAYISTAVTSGGAATLQWIMGEAANTTYDVVLSSVDGKADYADEAVLVHTDGGKAKAASVMKLDVGTADLTAGVVDVFISYYIGYAE
jgi:hypothetical protein